MNTDPLTHPGVPSYAAVLAGLRHIARRQVVRHRHDATIDILVRWGFIAWVRQPVRLSQQPVSARSPHCPVPEELATLTDDGRACLDWLAALEPTPCWATLRAQPYSLTGL
ncbi:hypothetical protein KTD33_00460 [Burkholderia gladioli]|uniref:hypothetical protein n=1 Tax=Burkholderia gladioli TaxID=28095 RepID=UPI000562E5D2|nr:hypothetical protein [Burkholderia gladioli]MBU9193001.1 hypothetical protein [Burkholderia gladioli]